MKKEYCKWRKIYRGFFSKDYYYDTDCGGQVDRLRMVENKKYIKFCFHCGKQIKWEGK